MPQVGHSAPRDENGRRQPDGCEVLPEGTRRDLQRKAVRP